jgi:plastocyanin
MNRLSRRSMIGGIAVLPFAAAGLGRVLAQDDSTPESTPAGSPEASPGASPSASPMASPAAGTVIEVDMLDTFVFEPSEFEVPKGGTIRIINRGYLEHDLQVDEWDGLETPEYLLHGETYDIIVPDEAEVGEEYVFYCSVAGHREGGMEGVLTVTEPE